MAGLLDPSDFVVDESAPKRRRPTGLLDPSDFGIEEAVVTPPTPFPDVAYEPWRTPTTETERRKKFKEQSPFGPLGGGADVLKRITTPTPIEIPSETGEPVTIAPGQEDVARGNAAVAAQDRARIEKLRREDPIISTLRGSRYGAGVAAGAFSTVQGIAALGPWLDTLMGTQTAAGTIGQEFANRMNDVVAALSPDDPGFLDALASGAGSMATFFIPGMTSAMAIKVLAKASPALAALAGTSVMTVLEAGTEAGSTFDELTRAGMPPVEASRRANTVLWQNIVLLAATNKVGIFGTGGVGKRAVKGAISEGAQEGAQEAIGEGQKLGEMETGADLLTPERLKQYGQSAAVGAILGGGAGAIQAAVETPASAPGPAPTAPAPTPGAPGAPVAAAGPAVTTPPLEAPNAVSFVAVNGSTITGEAVDRFVGPSGDMVVVLDQSGTEHIVAAEMVQGLPAEAATPTPAGPLDLSAPPPTAVQPPATAPETTVAPPAAPPGTPSVEAGPQNPPAPATPPTEPEVVAPAVAVGDPVAEARGRDQFALAQTGDRLVYQDTGETWEVERRGDYTLLHRVGEDGIVDRENPVRAEWNDFVVPDLVPQQTAAAATETASGPLDLTDFVEEEPRVAAPEATPEPEVPVRTETPPVSVQPPGPLDLADFVEPAPTERPAAPIEAPTPAPSTETAPTSAPGTEDFGSTNKVFTKDRADAARERIRQKLGGVNAVRAGVDFTVIPDLVELGGYHFEAGLREFGAWSEQMVQDVGEGVRKYLRSAFDMIAIRYEDATAAERAAEGGEAGGATTEAAAGPGERPAEQPGGADPGALEEAPPEDAPRPDEEREPRDEPVRGPGEDVGGAGGPAAAGRPGEPGVGGREGGVGVSAEREPGAAEPDPDAAPLTEPEQPTPATRPVAPGRDYRITDADRIGEGGPKRKYADNVAAIRLLTTIEEANRTATPEEQAVLVKYVGWGGLPGVFDPRAKWDTKHEWRKEYAELKGLLSEEDYDAAAGSTKNAHYTSPVVVRGVWSALRRLGFTGGRTLETSAGVGHFIGLMPNEMLPASRWTAIELDAITGRILKRLYPQSDVRQQGFERTRLPNGFYDAVVSNVPFGAYAVHDDSPDGKRYRRLGLTRFIHDYFFAKALDKVRPGGVVAFITSTGTLDKTSPRVRIHLARQAELVGAIRLPNTAFKAGAGTEVTTDILFLKRRAAPISAEEAGRETWTQVDTVTVGEGYAAAQLPLNRYYHEHPEMVLGRLARDEMHGYGRRGAEDDAEIRGRIAVEPDGRDLAAALDEAVARLPQGVIEPARPPRDFVADRGEDEGGSEGVIQRLLTGVLGRLSGQTPVTPAPAGAPLDSKDRMIQEFTAAMQRMHAGALTLQGGFHGPRGLHGFRNQHTGNIRLRRITDIDTFAHEAGHGLQGALGITKRALLGFAPEMRALAAIHGVKGPKMSEGFAEFVRLYMTDPAAAQATAPTFFPWFETRLGNAPDLRDAVLTYRDQALALRNAPPLERARKAIAFEEPPGPPLRERFAALRRSIIFEHFNTFLPIEQVEKIADPTKSLPASASPYLLARTLSGRVQEMARRFTDEGVVDYDSQEVTPGSKGLTQILEPIWGAREDYQLYEVLRRIQFLERSARTEHREAAAHLRTLTELPRPAAGVDPLVDAITTLEGAHPEFAGVLDELQTWNDGLLQYMADSGNYSQKAIDAIRDANAVYAPLHRLMDAEPGVTKPGQQGGTSTVNTPRAIRALGGRSERIILPTIEERFKQAYVMIGAAERNEVGKRLAELLGGPRAAGKNMGVWMDKIATPIRAAAFPLARIEKALKDAVKASGQSPKIVDRLDLSTLAMVFEPNIRNLPDNQVLIWRDGTPEVWQVHDQMLLRSLTALDKANLQGFLKGWYTAWSIARGVSRFFRAGIVLHPDFMVANTVRDQQEAALQGRGILPPFLKGIADRLAGGDAARRYAAGGGLLFNLQAIDRRSIERSLEDAMLGRWRQGNRVRGAIQILESLGEIAEMPTRTGIAKTVLQDPRPQDQAAGPRAENIYAAYVGRESTIDFGLHGASPMTTAVAQIITFLRPAMNAMYRNGRFLRDALLPDSMGGNLGGRETQRLAMVGGLMIVVEAMLYAWNQDDPRWEDLTEDQKTLNWILIPQVIPPDRWKTMTPAERLEAMGQVIKIPRGYLFGFLFGALPRHVLEWMFHNDRASFGKAMQSLEIATGVEYTPTIVKPLNEVRANYDWFRERPINPRRLEDLPPEMRFGPYTSETAKSASRALADLPGARAMRLTPNDVDHLIRGYLGHFGGTITAGVDMAKRLIEGGPAQPAWRLQDYPVIRRFLARYPNVRSEPIEDFYEAYRESREAMKGLKKLAETSKGAAVQDWKNEHALEIRMAGRLEAEAKLFAETRKEIEILLRDEQVGAEDKRDRIDVIVLKELDRARRVMGWVREQRGKATAAP